ncbi:MAG TPA: hypothetical protein VFH44_05735 [Solirubrobacterales bacterium]|nr:hypothetical protein [Solirubrobacterales bacterium]
MLEERDRAYKEKLAERLEPRIPSGERIEAVAVCQAGLPPWLQVAPFVAGLALVVAGFVLGGVPDWVGAVGALLVLAGIAGMTLVRRRLVVRTNRTVRVFALPGSEKVAIEAALAEVSLDELPADGGGSVRLGGERLWPNYGSGIEHDALARALTPPG